MKLSIRNIGNSIDYDKRHVYVRLPFWFIKNSGVALPIISLNNSDINLDIEFRSLKEVIKNNNYQDIENITKKNNSRFNFKILTEYIYLDSREKQFFRKNTHQYLIQKIIINLIQISQFI